MKETTCALCGKKISIAEDTVYKQHVLCPYCGGKFSYLADSVEFSPERLTYAIAERRKHNADNRYYNLAPAGARLYIGLIFYGKVFGGEMDANLYLAALQEIEPELKKKDWQYLLDNESDPELAAHFRDQLEFARTGPESTAILLPKSDTRTVRAEVASCGINPRPARRMVAEDRKSEAAAQPPIQKRGQQFIGRIVAMSCLVAIAIVGFILFRSVIPEKDESERCTSLVGDVSTATALPAEEVARPQDVLVGIVANKISELQERKDKLQDAIKEVREDRRRLESEIGRTVEQGNIKSAEAQAKGLSRLNGAETAMSVLKAPFFNELAVRYLGDKPFAKSDTCRAKIREAIASVKEMSSSSLEGVNQIAISYQESCVGDLRRSMEAQEREMVDLSKDISTAIRALRSEQIRVRSLERPQVAAKEFELEALFKTRPFTASCELSPRVKINSTSDADEFTAAIANVGSVPSPQPVVVDEVPSGTEQTVVSSSEPKPDVKYDVGKPAAPDWNAQSDDAEPPSSKSAQTTAGRRQKCKSPTNCRNFAEPRHNFCSDHECHSYGCKEHVRIVSSPNWVHGGLESLSRLNSVERDLIKRQCVGHYCKKHCCNRECPKVRNYKEWWSGYLYWDDAKTEKFFFCDNERLANSRYCIDHACGFPRCGSCREEYWKSDDGVASKNAVMKVDVDSYWRHWRSWYLCIAPMCRAHSNHDPETMKPRDTRTSGDLLREKESK